MSGMPYRLFDANNTVAYSCACRIDNTFSMPDRVAILLPLIDQPNNHNTTHLLFYHSVPDLPYNNDSIPQYFLRQFYSLYILSLEYYHGSTRQMSRRLHCNHVLYSNPNSNLYVHISIYNTDPNYSLANDNNTYYTHYFHPEHQYRLLPRTYNKHHPALLSHSFVIPCYNIAHCYYSAHTQVCKPKIQHKSSDTLYNNYCLLLIAISRFEYFFCNILPSQDEPNNNNH